MIDVPDAVVRLISDTAASTRTRRQPTAVTS
jgi:hypothetical protein